MKILQKIKKLVNGHNVAFLIFECLIILVLCLCTFFPVESYFAGNSDRLYFSSAETIASKSIIGRMIYMVLIAYLFYAIYKNFRTLRKMFLPSLAGILFIAYAMISCSWSGAFIIGFTKLYRMAAIFLFLACLYAKYGRRLTLYILASVIFISAALSVIAVIALPRFSLETPNALTGIWRGAFIQKNLLGQNMSFGVLFSVFCALISQTRTTRILSIVSACVCGVCLLKSSSATSVSSLFLALGFLAALYVISKKIADQKLQLVLYHALVAGSLAAGYVVGQTSLIFKLTGRSSDFTGRGIIWRNVKEAVAEKPIFGHGYGFWSIDSDIRSYVWSKIEYRVPHSHNTFLDLTLQLGVVGLALYIGLCASILFRCLREIRANQGLFPIFCLTVLLMLLIRSITETTLGFMDQDIFWYAVPLLGMALPRSSRRASASVASRPEPSSRRRRAHFKGY